MTTYIEPQNQTTESLQKRVEELLASQSALLKQHEDDTRAMGGLLVRNIELSSLLALFRTQHDLKAGGLCTCRICEKVREFSDKVQL